MCAATRLSAGEVWRSCSPSDIPYQTTAEARELPVAGLVGQERAAEALRFGIGIRREGYNLFVIGPPGLGKRTLLRDFLHHQAAAEKTPGDWCYVHDFENPERPRPLELPAGKGSQLQQDLQRMVEDLTAAMRAAFDSEEFLTQKKRLVGEFKERQRRAMAEIQKRAKERDVAVVETDGGIMLAPLRNGAALSPDAFEALPADQREKMRAETERVGDELQDLHRKFHEWRREHLDALAALHRRIAQGAAKRVIDALRARYAELPAVVEHLGAIERDAIESADEFLEDAEDGVEETIRRVMRRDHESFRRYQINVLVDQRQLRGAPVIFEHNPIFANVLGRAEHESQFGTLTTNFTLIRAGSLHRANGGYLVLDALKVLQQPFVWDALKRAIRSGSIEIESVGRALGLVTTVSLEPAPIPLANTKIVLTGERLLYYLLAELDPDFLELFKVVVDFEDTMQRRPEDHQVYARLVAGLVQKDGLKPFDQGAVARVIDHASRLAGDAEKLSVRMRAIADLLREADYWAGEAKHELVAASDVQKAIDAQLERSGRVRRQLQEMIRRKDILVSTAGESVGQVNGLSVFQLGEQSFGHPTRITARVRMGKGEVIDIERAVKLGGPIHSKGVLILGGFLGARYATRAPLSLSATLVFEQSYGGVEGDSASLAELCALLSAIAEVPLRQTFAVTGSLNQNGEVQSIGGVNEKIEGFFDACRERGLSGEQGVLIPRSNVKNLMLRGDVVEAIAAGKFQLHAVETVDDALELLTGKPSASVNAAVEARLTAFAEQARAFLARS